MQGVRIVQSTRSRELVKPLAGLLGVATDEAVFLDVNALKPGDKWEEEIFAALQECSVFVVCWCCQSQKSEFVGKEVDAALLDADKKVVPVLFCGADLPSALSGTSVGSIRGLELCMTVSDRMEMRPILQRSCQVLMSEVHSNTNIKKSETYQVLGCLLLVSFACGCNVQNLP